jgi:hypothetical protein
VVRAVVTQGKIARQIWDMLGKPAELRGVPFMVRGTRVGIKPNTGAWVGIMVDNGVLTAWNLLFQTKRAVGT